MNRTTCLRFVLVWSMLVLVGCSDTNSEDLPFAPIDCQSTKPATGFLNVEITVNAANPKVLVKLYHGSLETGNLLRSDSTSVSKFSYELAVDEHYTVTARYIVGPDTVLAINSDKITTEEKDYQDAVSCWDVRNGSVDVRLKL